VKDKYKVDPTNNPKAMLRFRKAVEVTKKTLSINPVTRFEVPCLMNDMDVNIEVKRDEFEEVIQELVNRIQHPVEKAMELAGVKKENLASIEIHGGGSRVAAVKRKIASIFGKDPTQSLNPDECFALGGGFQAAILSPQYQVNLNVKDVSPHAVYVEYVDHEGNKKHLELFKQFNQVPSTKKLPIKVVRAATIHLYCENEEIGTVQLDTGKDELLLVQVLIRLTPDSLVDVKSAVYHITKEEETSPEEPNKEEPKKDDKKEGEIEPPKEGETTLPKEESAKKIIKTIEVKVNFDFTTSYGLANTMISEMKAQEKEMAIKDELEQKIDDVRNELETYLFRMNNGLTRDFPLYFDPAKKFLYLEKVNEIQDWFSENEFDRLPLQDYESKLQVLKEFGEPALVRKDSREKLPSLIKQYDVQADDLTKRLATKDAKFAHITDEDRAPAKKSIEDFKAWLVKKQEEVEKQALHLEVAFKSFDADFKIKDLTSQVNKVMSKAKPPPPKPEPKPEEAKKESETKQEGESKEVPKAEETHTEAASPEGTSVEAKKPENQA
jgi:molecular chaperone DnaK (HSP70)